MKLIARTVSALVALGLAFVLIPASPASGESCTDTCRTKQSTCDATCDGKKVVCVAQCGLPISPGYDKCAQKCADDRSTCSLECQGEEKVCEMRCKTGL
jgi:hypothetical protein